MRVTLGGMIATIILLLAAYGAFRIFVVGNPDAAKFRDECYRRYAVKSPPPEEAMRAIAADCEAELRRHLDMSK